MCTKGFEKIRENVCSRTFCIYFRCVAWKRCISVLIVCDNPVKHELVILISFCGSVFPLFFFKFQFVLTLCCFRLDFVLIQLIYSETNFEMNIYRWKIVFFYIYMWKIICRFIGIRGNLLYKLIGHI